MRYNNPLEPPCSLPPFSACLQQAFSCAVHRLKALINCNKKVEKNTTCISNEQARRCGVFDVDYWIRRLWPPCKSRTILNWDLALDCDCKPTHLNASSPLQRGTHLYLDNLLRMVDMEKHDCFITINRTKINIICKFKNVYGVLQLNLKYRCLDPGDLALLVP